MNKDYIYCVGFGIDAIPVTLCKNCRRLFPFGNQTPKDDIWWTAPQYDPETGKCPIYEPKTNNNK